MQPTTIATTTAWSLNAELVKLRRYHACGLGLWINDQQQPAVYEEVQIGVYVEVTQCPQCQATLTAESLRADL